VIFIRVIRGLDAFKQADIRTDPCGLSDVGMIRRLRRMNLLPVVPCLVLAGSLAAFAGEHVIVIDPGHGGAHDAGTQAERTLSAANNATSPGKVLEKDLTLELSQEIVKQIKLLAEKHPATHLVSVMTRTKDENPDFSQRAAICAKANPAAIFSVHFNASENHKSLGTLAVVYTKTLNANYAADEAFAEVLVHAADRGVKAYLPKSTAMGSISDAHLHGGAGSNFFFQLAKYPELKTVPRCFLEVEFIDRADVDSGLLEKRKEAFPAIAREIAEALYARFP